MKILLSMMILVLSVTYCAEDASKFKPMLLDHEVDEFPQVIGQYDEDDPSIRAFREAQEADAWHEIDPDHVQQAEDAYGNVFDDNGEQGQDQVAEDQTLSTKALMNKVFSVFNYKVDASATASEKSAFFSTNNGINMLETYLLLFAAAQTNEGRFLYKREYFDLGFKGKAAAPLTNEKLAQLISEIPQVQAKGATKYVVISVADAGVPSAMRMNNRTAHFELKAGGSLAKTYQELFELKTPIQSIEVQKLTLRKGAAVVGSVVAVYVLGDLVNDFSGFVTDDRSSMYLD